jgi:glycosyltransferase involved in cell wall biosynthesis
MQDRKRILILENAIDVTGGLKSILNSSKALHTDFEFIVALPVNSRCANYTRDQGFRVVELPFRELNKSILSIIVYLPALIVNTLKLKRLVKELDIDLIIANDFYNLLPCCYRFFAGKVPYICFVRFMPDRFPKMLVAIWESCHQKFAKKVIAVSGAVKRKLKIAEAEVVYEGLPEIYTTLNKPAHKQPSETSTLLYLSNYIEGKGHTFALQSFKKLAESHPSWKLRFVGGDMGTQKNKDYKQFLVNESKELKIQNQVEWIGFTEDIRHEYFMADVVLNFSNSESFSLTCLEAMTAGRAVISTDSGGPAEIIEQNKSGILVPVGDIASMTAAMGKLMNNPELRTTMGNQAFYHVRRKFNFDHTIGKLRTFYLRALTT